MLKTLGDIGFDGAAMGALVFMFTYSITSPWWRKAPGRYLWVFGSVVTLIFLLAVIVRHFGQLPGLLWIRAFAYLSLASVIWGAVVALVRVQVLRHRATRMDQNV